MPAHSGGPPKSSLGGKQSIASSNATVTTFLSGGRQQKSWITGTAVKPTYRPASFRQSAPQAVPPQFAQSVLLSPAPSDEPSPAVSNAHDSPNPHPAALPGAQIMANPAHSLPVAEARFVHDLSIDAPPPVTAAQFSPTNRPTPVLASNNVGLSPDLGVATYTGSSVVQSNSFGSSASGAASGQGQVLRNSPVVQNGAPPAKRRRTDPAMHMRFAPLVHKVDSHVRARGGDQNITADVEKPRLQLLKTACVEEDIFFLTLHQLFCIWSESPASVQGFLHHPPSTTDRAFSVLESVLKKNQLISAPTRSFFAAFPAPISQLIATPAYTTTIEQVSVFLGNLANKFPILTTELLNRRYPYMVHELKDGLGCHSTVLQIIFFTACRRRLGVLDGPLGVQMEELFKRDQKRSIVDGTIEENLAWNGQLARIYRNIVAAVEQGSPTTRTAVSSASPSAVQSPIFAARAQVVPSNGPRTHSDASPTGPVPVASSYSQGYGQLVPPPAAPIPTLSYQGEGVPITHYGQNQNTQGQLYPATVHLQHIAQQQLQLQDPQMSQQFQHQQLHQQQLQQQFQQQQRRQQLQMQQIGQVHQAHLSNVQQRQQTQQSIGLGIDSPPLLNANNFAPPTQQLAISQLRAPDVGNHPSPVTRPYSVTGDVHHGVNGSFAMFPQPHQVLAHGTLANPDRPLLPPAGQVITRTDWPYDSQDRKAVLMGLHQASSRSPKRIVKGRTERFYQAPKSLPVGPVLITPKTVVQTLNFEVTKEQLKLASPISVVDRSAVVEHFNGSLRWRLRACKVTIPNKALSEQQWVTMDTSWPTNIYITCNGRIADIRRKPHNGKDLAIELTDLVVCGSNNITIALPEQAREASGDRFVAVELLETLSHSEVIKLVRQSGIIPPEQTLQTIRQRLTGSSSSDDGVVFDEPNLAIDLADPFSAVIFETPARGVACTHMECFDLENMLNSRLPKQAQNCPHGDILCECPSAVEPTFPDKWRCPICDKDARPYSLRIDGFLLQVRQRLAEEGKLQTKSMRVNQDGTWTVVVEADDDLDSDEEGSVVPTKVAAPPTIARRQEVEVIEID